VYPAYEVSFWPKYDEKSKEFYNADSSWEHYWGNQLLELSSDYWEQQCNYSDLMAALQQRKHLLPKEIHLCKESGLHGGMQKIKTMVHIELVYGYTTLPPAPVLHWAIHFEFWTLVRAFLDAGADPHQISKGSVVPQDLIAKIFVRVQDDSNMADRERTGPIPDDLHKRLL